MGVNLKGYSLSPENKINLFQKASVENNMILEIGDIEIIIDYTILLLILNQKF